MLASKAKAPVYLVAHNAGEFLAKKTVFIKRTRFALMYISANRLDTAEMSASEINQQVESWLSQHFIICSSECGCQRGDSPTNHK